MSLLYSSESFPRFVQIMGLLLSANDEVKKIEMSALKVDSEGRSIPFRRVIDLTRFGLPPTDQGLLDLVRDRINSETLLSSQAIAILKILDLGLTHWLCQLFAQQYRNQLLSQTKGVNALSFEGIRFLEELGSTAGKISKMSVTVYFVYCEQPDQVVNARFDLKTTA